MHATLISWGWLLRQLEVELPEGRFIVTYNGRGFGYESVYVDEQVAEHATSLLWFVPVFVFPLGRRLGTIEVRVWPWLALRSLHLIVDGEVLYAEGTRSAAHVPPGWVEELGRRWHETGKVSDEVTRKLAGLADARGRIRGPEGDVRRPGDGGAGG